MKRVKEYYKSFTVATKLHTYIDVKNSETMASTTVKSADIIQAASIRGRQTQAIALAQHEVSKAEEEGRGSKHTAADRQNCSSKPICDVSSAIPKKSKSSASTWQVHDAPGIDRMTDLREQSIPGYRCKLDTATLGTKNRAIK